jgi:predicted enzyme related to lactoylglutathione lyase
MVFTDITLITEDVLKLVHFYEQLFGISIEKNKIHTQFEIESLRITLYSQRAAESDMEFNFSQYNGTGKMSIGFNFEDIDHEVIKLKELGVEIVAGPKTYSWGAKAVHFRDPDGNIICFRCWPKDKTI